MQRDMTLKVLRGVWGNVNQRHALLRAPNCSRYYAGVGKV